MTHRTYQSVARAARELAAAGDAQSALDLLTREAPAFPLHTAVAALARAKLLAQLGDSRQGLTCISAALDAGYRLRSEWLQDPGLTALESDPRFGELAARVDREYALASADTRPDLRIVPPDVPAPATGYPVLVALHGNGSNIELTVPYWRAAGDRGWLLVLPQSSEVGSAPGTYLWADRDRAASEIASHMTTVRDTFQIDERRLVLAGFSGGATHALALALTARSAARGVIAIAPYLPVIGEFSRRIEGGAASALRVYLVVGEEDESGFNGSRGLAEILAAHAVPARLEAHPGLGHEYPPDMAATLGAALSFVAP